jgi:hypothetical protein
VHTDLSAGQGSGSGHRRSLVIDPATRQIRVATSNGANLLRPSLFSTAL